MQVFEKRYDNRLKAQKAGGLYRNPPPISRREGRFVTTGGKELVNFASNDYLGLAGRRELMEIAAENFKRYGNSSSSSRLVSAHFDVVSGAEEKFARFFGYESALFFSSGFQTNLAVMSTLFDEGDAVFFDKRVHASTIKGLSLSKAGLYGYGHNNLTHFEKRWAKHAGEYNAVVTEALFSMDGDSPDFDALASMKKEKKFMLVTDEAHSFGVLGESGRGLSTGLADIAVGALGKAFGFFGGFALMPKKVKSYLFNFAAPLIYSTSLPAAHAVTAAATLDVVKKAGKERAHVKALGLDLRKGLTDAGFGVSGDGPILSVLMGDEEKAAAVSLKMRDHGILAFSARYPTVPLKKAIIRVSVNALMTFSDVERFITALTQSMEEV